MSKPFVILGHEIKKGKSAVIDMDVAKLPTRNNLSVPIIVHRSKKEGPVLLLIGGVHGDEVNGVAIVRDIIRKKINKPLIGTVICIPVFNVFGYLNQQREFPDGRDLNRMFPGSVNGSLASQFAYQFTQEIAPLVDYVVDFHTGGASRENYPNVRCDFNNESALNLAKIFGAKFIVDSDYISKSIRDLFNKMGKTILLFEGGKALNLDVKVIRCGVNGALNIMKHLGMHSGDLIIDNEYTLLRKNKWIRAGHSGIFETLVENGSHVKKKDVIGRISDPYGEFQRKVFAPFDSCIYGVNTAPMVYKGDALFHVSID